MAIIEWIKHNKIFTLVLLVVAYFIWNLSQTFFGVNLASLNMPVVQKGQSESYDASIGLGAPSQGSSRIGLPIYPTPDYAPQPNAENRLVIQESDLSLLVKDVVDTRNKILEYTDKNGGYMVNASTSNPEDAPTATVVIRIPADKLQNALDNFHSLSIKVVSENLLGRDVTDQYIDIDTRIAQLERTMARLEQILETATEVSDITNLTQQIINYQNQIDALVGQQDALEKNAQLAKLTIYLSTDEIALPYAPSDTFRPAVIFKLAVRSLVGFLRDLATFAIWIGVYSVIWIPAIIIYALLRKWFKRTKS